MTAFVFMLTKQEQEFLHYWQQNRLLKKKFLKQFSIAIPIGVVMVVAFLINVLSGWYKKADMVLRGNSSVVVVILIAVVGIIFFITYFSGNYKWEQNEQRYQELKVKEAKEA
jgi:membrane protein YdbS with pleckstrin-like domain